MSKKKTQNQPEELETVTEAVVEPVAETPAPAVEALTVGNAPVPPTPTPKPKQEPVAQHQVVKTPKKRIRIRKKATKKLSAAILIKDPTITRFI